MTTADEETLTGAARQIGVILGAPPLGEVRSYAGFRSEESRGSDCVIRVRYLGIPRRILGIAVEIADGAFVREVRFAEFQLAPFSHGINRTVGLSGTNPLEASTALTRRYGGAVQHLSISRDIAGTHVEIRETNENGDLMLRAACLGLNVRRGTL